MRCLIVQPIHEHGLATLRGAGIEPVPCPSPDMATVARLIPGCEAVITRDAGLSRAAILAGEALRVVVVHGTGYDPVDIATATSRGVLVCNTPGANARSVAELALALALSAARCIPAADRSARSGGSGFRETARFSELTGKTALIVGWGSVGSMLGAMLHAAFAMKILAYSPRVPTISGAVRVETLSEGMAQADLISLHTPLRPETRGMIGRKVLSAAKRGVILVNTGRAGLVDDVALAEALADGRVAAAGLDVYSPGAPEGPLAAFETVIFTPHLGGTTPEALSRVAREAAHIVLQALSGQRPATALNEPVGGRPCGQ